MSATKGRRRVCCTKYVHSNESNLSYCTKICGVYTKTKATNVEGLWVNGA